MIIPLVGQASCKGMSSAGATGLCRGAGHVSRAVKGVRGTILGQHRQRGREAASIPKHPLKEGSRCVVLNWTAKRSRQLITEAATPDGVSGAGSTAETAGTERNSVSKMLAF